MDHKTKYGRIIFNGDSFDFYLNYGYCDCGDCENCNIITCSVKVINGKVTDINSGETFEDIIYDYLVGVGYSPISDAGKMFREYEKYFKVFEQYVINNHKPTGRFTKPAMH